MKSQKQHSTRKLLKKHPIELIFGSFILKATLFNTKIARKFEASLPCQVKLMKWGNEFYGPVDLDLGEENPVGNIPPGGLAYTNQGNYFCIFFGQNPAWPVEYIGHILDDQWQRLVQESGIDSVEVRKDR